MQYAIDLVPEPTEEAPQHTIYQMKKQAHQKRVIIEAQKEKKIQTRAYARIMPSKRSRWRIR